jgi:hypothetical protein
MTKGGRLPLGTVVSATIGMTHDVVAAGYPGHFEPISF